MSVIELFYDVISPYSYLAFTQLSAYALLWRFTLRLQPVFQGAVMKGANNTPPATVPAKQAYMVLSDLPRLSRYHQLPLVVPSNFSTFMFHTLTTMRTLAAVQLHQPDKLALITRLLFECVWQRDANLMEPKVLAAALAEAGLSAAAVEQLLTASQSSEAKLALRRNTDRLLEAGGFGVPTLLVSAAGEGGKEGEQPQLVFGSDRMHIVAQLLGVEWKELQHTQHTDAQTATGRPPLSRL